MIVQSVLWWGKVLRKGVRRVIEPMRHEYGKNNTRGIRIQAGRKMVVAVVVVCVDLKLCMKIQYENSLLFMS